MKVLSFTGSPQVGFDLKARAGKKKCLLELGGNAACIIDRDADLDDSVSRTIIGAFYQSGQSCISVQRIFIHSDIYDTWIAKFVTKAAALKMGDPLKEDTFIGPMISEESAQRIEKWVQESIDDGARVLTGGKRNGVFYNATVVENVGKKCKLVTEEAFGPVCTVDKFTDFKAACEQVNESIFGLQTGIFTRDLNKSFYAFENIECGGVVINDVPSMRIDSQPYGGTKDSGNCREGIRYAIESMTEQRIMIMRNAGVINDDKK